MEWFMAGCLAVIAFCSVLAVTVLIVIGHTEVEEA